jgi:L-asparagine oxygenase
MFTSVTHAGFALQKAFAPSLPTLEVARALGTVVDVAEVLPGSGIRTVQLLRPKGKDEAGRNQYSGNFGFGTFPFHSDLAHWAIPPRYLLLRCIVGSDDVFTHVLPWTRMVGSLGAPALRKAVFATRKRKAGSSGLVRALSRYHQAEVFRWDPIFLSPLNDQARTLARLMRDAARDSIITNVLLREQGDTLLIDNWRMLHGRGEVKPQSRNRRVERVYLSEVKL